jgi:hypothetical protein
VELHGDRQLQQHRGDDDYDTINKADAVVVVTPYSVTYDGLSHSAAITSITG